MAEKFSSQADPLAVDYTERDFNPRLVRNDTKFPEAIIGPKCRITGTLECDGVTAFAGTFEGEIKAQGELIIEESAVVIAQIYGNRVKIFGRVDGDINCQERLELHAGARVTGNLNSPKIVIQDGVVFEGYCSMQRPGEASPLREPSKSDTSKPEKVGIRQDSSRA